MVGTLQVQLPTGIRCKGEPVTSVPYTGLPKTGFLRPPHDLNFRATPVPVRWRKRLRSHAPGAMPCLLREAMAGGARGGRRYTGTIALGRGLVDGPPARRRVYFGDCKVVCG